MFYGYSLPRKIHAREASQKFVFKGRWRLDVSVDVDAEAVRRRYVHPLNSSQQASKAASSTASVTPQVDGTPRNGAIVGSPNHLPALPPPPSPLPLPLVVITEQQTMGCHLVMNPEGASL